MPQRARFHETFASKTTGLPLASKSVTVYREGATANGAQSGTTPLTVPVRDNGKIVAADDVFVNAVTGTTYTVDSTTSTQVVLSGFSGTLELADGDRLIPSGSKPTLYSDDQGGASTTNPLTTSASGLASAWIAAGAYDHVLSGSGVDTTLYQGIVHVRELIDTTLDIRGVRTRGEPVLNVKHSEFGAKGDGSTDDTAAIQAAVDVVEGLSDGGTVLLPAGTFVYGSGLTLNGSAISTLGGSHHGKIIFKGAGRTLTRLLAKSDFTAGNVMIDCGASGSSSDRLKELEISDMWLDGNGRDVDLMRWYWVSRARMNNVLFRNTTGHGLHIENGYDHRYNDCFWELCGGDATHYGTFVDADDASDTVNNLYFQGCRWENWIVNGGTGGGFVKVDSSGMSGSANKLRFVSCKFHGNTTLAELASRAHVHLTSADQVDFVACTMVKAKGSFVELDTCTGIHFIGGDYNGNAGLPFHFNLDACTNVSFASIQSSIADTAYIDLDASCAGISFDNGCLFTGSTTVVQAAGGAEYVGAGRRDAAATELTLDTSGIITVRPDANYYNLDTFEDAGTDDLVTISGGYTGQVIVLQSETSGRDVTLKDTSGNLNIGADFTLATVQDTIALIFGGTNWSLLSKATN